MSTTQKLRDIAPYLLVLCAAVYLYYVADHIAYTAIPDQMGPERWPKIIISLLAGVCALEIVRRSIAPAAVDTAAEPDEFEQELLVPAQTHVPLVFGTIAATIAYLLILDRCGFAFSTSIFAACLMWLGGFRRLGLVAVLSVLLSVFLSFVFMKLIFVALPLGYGPFEKISLAIMSLVGVH